MDNLPPLWLYPLFFAAFAGAVAIAYGFMVLLALLLIPVGMVSQSVGYVLGLRREPPMRLADWWRTAREAAKTPNMR